MVDYRDLAEEAREVADRLHATIDYNDYSALIECANALEVLVAKLEQGKLIDTTEHFIKEQKMRDGSIEYEVYHKVWIPEIDAAHIKAKEAAEFLLEELNKNNSECR